MHTRRGQHVRLDVPALGSLGSPLGFAQLTPCFSLPLMVVALPWTLQTLLPCSSCDSSTLEPGHWQGPEGWGALVEWLP